jgi:hypothetical protein
MRVPKKGFEPNLLADLLSILSAQIKLQTDLKQHEGRTKDEIKF